MARATWILGATTVIGFGLSTYLFVENRGLRAAEHSSDSDAHADGVAAAGDPWLDAKPPRNAAIPKFEKPPEEPKLPEEVKKEESRMERRARRTAEMAAFLGRLEGETDEQYRERMVPLITGGLAIPRERALAMRKEAEAKAGVTPAQSAALDQAFEKTYADALDYTNKAIVDGTLSPYERNVSGWLEFAGGMGGILGEANQSIGKILDAGQVRAMSDAGFEWGEYLGFTAPWERIQPPGPPPKPTTGT